MVLIRLLGRLRWKKIMRKLMWPYGENTRKKNTALEIFSKSHTAFLMSGKEYDHWTAQEIQQLRCIFKTLKLNWFQNFFEIKSCTSILQLITHLNIKSHCITLRALININLNLPIYWLHSLYKCVFLYTENTTLGSHSKRLSWGPEPYWNYVGSLRERRR